MSAASKAFRNSAEMVLRVLLNQSQPDSQVILRGRLRQIERVKDENNNIAFAQAEIYTYRFTHTHTHTHTHTNEHKFIICILLWLTVTYTDTHTPEKMHWGKGIALGLEFQMCWIDLYRFQIKMINSNIFATGLTCEMSSTKESYLVCLH
jgi:hypothetical protein